MKPCCEFSRKIPLNQIQKKQTIVKMEANEEERLALSKRFSIPALYSLECIYRLTSFHGGQVRAEGKIKATIAQNCVLSLEDFDVTVEEEFELHFMPVHKVGAELEEIEDPDVIPYEHDVIDLGEVSAEQLALLLDPYPHKPGYDNTLILQEKDIVSSEEEVQRESPFKVLEKLKKVSLDKKK